MLLIILLYLIVAAGLLLSGKALNSGRSNLMAIIPGVTFVYFLSKLPSIKSGNIVFESSNWVSALGVNFSFRLDGLSLLFALLISGIGTLIFIYASAYLKGHKYINHFFAYMLVFTAAMLGMVLANNIILLFIFWELTSISSFFLIGFNNEDAASRRSALMALSITGLGGFFLMVALVIMGQITDSYSIGVILEQATAIKNSRYYPLVLAFFLLGAFTKSAQFPFYFWLPGAMKAPTPVSAYLHSATMVKAGIFIMARFTPVLGGTVTWQIVLVAFGGITMAFAAYRSLFKKDLKAILAYSTISALGILTFLLGIGSSEALIAASVFIVVHALYKAPLFMVAGIIDHETGTRDLTQLSGLAKVMMPVAITGTLAALSSAGLPSTIGFIGKDLIYESTLHFTKNWTWYFTGLALFTNVGLVAAGFLAGIKPFLGKLPQPYEKVHLPSAKMWIPPLILAVLGLVFGLFPNFFGKYFTEAAVKAITQNYVPFELKIWHGFNLVFILSLATILAGGILYFAASKSLIKAPRYLAGFTPESIFLKIFMVCKNLSKKWTDYFHDGYLRSYLIKIIIFAELLLAFDIYRGGFARINFQELSPISIYDVVIAIILIVALYKTLKTSSRLSAVVTMSIIGYAICLIFVIYSAPDLAMTQFTIDTLTVVLFVLVLYRLPPFLKFRNRWLLIRDLSISLVFGTLLAIISLRVLYEPTTYEISEYYAKNAYRLGKGKNVVNVILVDFRGFDTMFEIVVLSIAAIGVYSLLKLRLKSSEKE